MRKTALLLVLLASQVWAVNYGQALRNNPYRGDGSKGGSFHIALKDSLVSTAWARVTQDTGFTQKTSDTTLTWMFSPTNDLDSLRKQGKTYSGLQVTAIWTGSGTADSTTNNLFFQHRAQTDPTPASVSAVYGTGWSFVVGSYLARVHASLFDVAGNWALPIWVNSNKAANPAATEIFYSVYNSPDIIQMGFDPNGNVFARISDDGRANWDSVGLTADRYDSLWHFVVFQTRSDVAGANDSLRITADRLVSASTLFANAATSLTLDTVQVGAFRAASKFQGRADEAYYVEDTLTFARDAKLYAWLRGQQNLNRASDSAMVRWFGIRKDTVSSSPLDTVTMATKAVSDSQFSIFEAAFLDTIEVLPLIAYDTGGSPTTTKRDSIPIDRYFYNPLILAADKWENLILDEITFSSPDLSMADTVHFQVRVYPEWKRAQGAGTQYYILPGSERSVTAVSGEATWKGPWTIQGPVVVEFWARASAAASIGQAEVNGFRGRYGR